MLNVCRQGGHFFETKIHALLQDRTMEGGSQEGASRNFSKAAEVPQKLKQNVKLV